MSVNYYNSAGTDLDNLFYVNNGNAGAIGFVEASGQDLGNRYTNASTLGYSVGYVNGSGTDLGYLRGNLVPPGITNYWANQSTTKTQLSYTDNTRTDHEDEVYTDTTHKRNVATWISAGANCVGTGSLNWQLCICMIAGAQALSGCYFAYWDNTTTTHPDTFRASSTAHFENKSISAWGESQWFTVYNGGCGNTPGRNFTVSMWGGYSDGAQGQNSNVQLGLRVYQRCYSSYGDTGWRHNDIWFG